MGETTATDSPEVREAAERAAAVAPDPETAALLAKHAAGEKLENPSQYGKVGAWKQKLQRLWSGKAGNGAESAPAASLSGQPAPMVAPAPEASDSGLAAVPIDAALVRRTTAAVLARCDSIAVRYVGNAAREIGASGEALARLERAAALSKDDKALMIEISPDVCASLGLNPRHFPLAIFVGTLGAWATDLWLAVQEVKGLKKPGPSPSPGQSNGEKK